MTRDEAKKILALYRPDVTDDDPRMAEALELVQRDPELAAWFQQQCAVFDAIRSKLKSIPVPQGLHRQIIAENTAGTHVLSLTNRLLLASAVAALILLAGIIWMQVKPNSQNTFDGYRNRMASSIQRTYAMDMHERDQAKIREYFAGKDAPADYVLPKNLDKLPGEGGMVLKWNDHQVCLLCLDASNNSGSRNDLYLFMANRSVLPGAPAAGKQPQFKSFNKLTTVTWTVGDRVYLLAGTGDEAELRKYLE